jgi:hypothetical protein
VSGIANDHVIRRPDSISIMNANNLGGFKQGVGGDIFLRLRC